MFKPGDKGQTMTKTKSKQNGRKNQGLTDYRGLSAINVKDY